MALIYHNHNTSIELELVTRFNMNKTCTSKKQILNLLQSQKCVLIHVL